MRIAGPAMFAQSFNILYFCKAVRGKYDGQDIPIFHQIDRMYSFQFELNLSAVILFGTAVLLLAVYIFTFLSAPRRVFRAVRKDGNGTAPEGICPVSVIIVAGEHTDSLKKLLPAVLGQKYNGPFEVIVVNVGSSDATAEVVEKLRLIHDNLYLTYTPEGARQLSRKKLGLMIGIKAARYPFVVHTTDEAVVASDEWLAGMTDPFIDASTEVVIGYSGLDPSNDRSHGRRARLFNDTADTVAWLASALKGRPYRGTELNLAYTRDIFFRNRGFSKTLNLKHGDDDIFIHEIATPENTAVVLRPDTLVRRTSGNAKKTYNELQNRYRFTGDQLPHKSRRLQAIGTWALWGILITCGLGIFVTLPNLFGLTIGLIIILAAFMFGSLVWGKTVRSLTGRRLFLTVPFLTLARPFSNIRASVRARMNRRYNYTWNN